MNIINEKGVEDLCNAVVILAAKDYHGIAFFKVHTKTSFHGIRELQEQGR